MKNTKGVSLKILAKEVGVSVATVSLVLNGKDKNGRVSKEVSRKIIEKANELNYIPNTLAKALKVGNSKTIGLIVADISNVFFGTLALYIQNYAEKRGYAVLMGNTNERLEEMSNMITLLTARQVDGLIITPTEGSLELVKYLVDNAKPLVLLDRSFPELHVDSVLINNFEISYNSTTCLIERGCRNIAFVTYKQNQYHINERRRGFIEAMTAHGLFQSDTIREVRHGFLIEDMEKAISYILGCEEKIDAVFFATNSISVAGVKSLLERRIAIQDDIQIMCFDESEAFYLLPISFPFIKQPIEEMAKKTIELLVDQIEKQSKRKAQNCVMEAQLVLN